LDDILSTEVDQEMTSYVNLTLPIFEFILPQKCIDEANEVIDNWKQSGEPAPEISNVRAKQTQCNLQMPKTVEFTALCCKMISNLVYNAGGRVYGGLNDGTNDIEYIARDCWGIDYSPGDYTVPHNHFPADFSAVGFLKLEEGCSPVRFHGAGMFMDCTFQPSERQLIIFDGKILHSVPPTSAERRVVALNLFKEPGTY
tara:strand:+ start:1642 stop:2238 length:597 start_codon:yes stop_codon:yes gene_type:complete